MIKLNEKVIEILESNGFDLQSINEQTNGICAEIQQYTPEGEDWYEVVWFDGTDKGFIKGVEENYKNYDVEEEAEIWINQRGKNGVPDSIANLIEDSKWKKEKLQLLSMELNKIEL